MSWSYKFRSLEELVSEKCPNLIHFWFWTQNTNALIFDNWFNFEFILISFCNYLHYLNYFLLHQNPVIGLSCKFLFPISETSIRWYCKTVQSLIASILSLVWWRSIFAIFGLLIKILHNSVWLWILRYPVQIYLCAHNYWPKYNM